MSSKDRIPLSNTETESMVIHKTYIMPKPDFMTKERLAEELGCSVRYIENLMTHPKENPVLKEEVHYSRRGNKFIRFYYPQIKKDIAPSLANVF